MKISLTLLSLFSFFLSASCQDSLLCYRGKKVTSVADWQNNRRPELKNLTLENIYGFMPASPAWDSKIIKEVLLKEQNILYKEVAIQLYKEHLPTRTIRLSVFIPAQKSGPSCTKIRSGSGSAGNQ